MTAALHGLARHAGGAPVQAGPAGGNPAVRTPASDPDLDVRDLPPARRHEAIFAAYHALTPGTGFVLVNDHDPKPLRYQFEAEHAGQFTWDYRQAGPQAWRVRIGRPLTATPSGAGETGGAGSDGKDGGGQSQTWTYGSCRTGSVMTRSSPPTGRCGPGAGSCWPATTTRCRCGTSSRLSTAASPPGTMFEAGPGTWRVRIGRASA